MLAKEIEYKDFNGNMRKETFLFNLSQAEVMEMELSTTGGLAESIQRVVEVQDGPEIIRIFKSLILKAYGEKSADGRRFVKSEELSKEFSETNAYSRSLKTKSRRCKGGCPRSRRAQTTGTRRG